MNCRGFEPICSPGQIRAYFQNMGLSYDSINEGDILVLVMMMQREIKQANEVGETSVSTMRLSKRIDTKLKTNGTIISCYLYMNSHYFTRREAISFNPDGFIGFAGWADQGNLNPLLRAFRKWCDYLKDGMGE